MPSGLSIAVAAQGLQPVTIHDVNATATLVNDLLRLEHQQRFPHLLSHDAQHLRNELLRPLIYRGRWWFSETLWTSCTSTETKVRHYCLSVAADHYEWQ